MVRSAPLGYDGPGEGWPGAPWARREVACVPRAAWLPPRRSRRATGRRRSVGVADVARNRRATCGGGLRLEVGERAHWTRDRRRGRLRCKHVPPDLHERHRDGLKSWYTYKGPSPSLCAAHASESPSPDGDLTRAVPVLGP